MNINLPTEKEKPSEYAERLGNIYSHTTAQNDKKHKGQFFTPGQIVRFMAAQADVPAYNDIRILDPGCGSAILSCSLIEALSAKSDKPINIVLDLYDTDIRLVPVTETVLAYLQNWCEAEKINLTYNLYPADFVLENADSISNQHTLFGESDNWQYDYIISNPPFGIDWEASEKRVKAENDMGEAGRFAPGLPAKGDGQMLFMLNGVAKLKEEGRMAIIQNGSPLFKGDAGSGESEIRGYLLEHDWLEAIVQLPNDLFYNTGIATYIWVVSKNKSEERAGKVQLIDASKCFKKLRKPLGNKRVEITTICRELIMQAYHDFTDWEYTSELNPELKVESKVKDVEDFKFTKLTINRPLRLEYKDIHFDEASAENYKEADRALLKEVATYWENNMPNHVGFPDITFFLELKKAKIKVPQGKVALLRSYFGKRNPDMMEAYVKPVDQESGFAPDPELKDSEIIPWKEDIAEYLDKNVRPYAPDFWYNESESKIGYEIPLTREFYKYTPLTPSSVIFDELKKLEEKESELMSRILG